jgi:hypothetical protein
MEVAIHLVAKEVYKLKASLSMWLMYVVKALAQRYARLAVLPIVHMSVR